ncbi:uncharacterized protein LOC143918405 [Arctopsyche grandis]|uniref:uncharacterized protein LOC143918405 n=1 Tax=Arctopsyche grandis TaxID=121162 RepID=UPI00406D9808
MISPVIVFILFCLFFIVLFILVYYCTNLRNELPRYYRNRIVRSPHRRTEPTNITTSTSNNTFNRRVAMANENRDISFISSGVFNDSHSSMPTTFAPKSAPLGLPSYEEATKMSTQNK